ncbi:MAG: hypothetical protein ABIQ88_21945 [Chitinophagaceae bacterium]
MTNLLVPTDFTPASLKLAEQAIKVLNREVNIILFHAFEMPYYYTDFVRPDNQPWQEIMNDDLRQACKQLKERYPWLINSISCRFMQGNSSALFRNWIEANDIHMIACPASYIYTRIHARSLNPVQFFKKSRIQVLQDFTLQQKKEVANGQEQQEKKVTAYSIAS